MIPGSVLISFPVEGVIETLCGLFLEMVIVVGGEGSTSKPFVSILVVVWRPFGMRLVLGVGFVVVVAVVVALVSLLLLRTNGGGCVRDLVVV